MIKVCQSAPGGQPPKLDRLDAKLDDLLAMVLGARPDLAGGAAAVGPADGAADGAAVTAGTGSGGATITIQTAPGGVADHKVAFRMLQAVEKYFVTTEPASLALLLVVQARLLVGRPLVEALDALMENNSGYAKINFGSDSGFSISMSRMRDLSYQANIPTTEGWGAEEAAESYDAPSYEADTPVEDNGEAALPAETVEAAPIKQLEVVSRDHAGMVLKQVEEFFHIREPASPIPVLLFKARSLLAKDFHALTRELIPPEAY
jgi:type VI secretion system protein ImpA